MSSCKYIYEHTAFYILCIDANSTHWSQHFVSYHVLKSMNSHLMLCICKTITMYSSRCTYTYIHFCIPLQWSWLLTSFTLSTWKIWQDWCCTNYMLNMTCCDILLAENSSRFHLPDWRSNGHRKRWMFHLWSSFCRWDLRETKSWQERNGVYGKFRKEY